MRIIFMGTPDFAVRALDALCASGEEVILAVTQPDRQKGRGRKVIRTPVRLCAEKWGVPVFQPAKIREPEAVAKIRELAPDLIVVAAFGQILPQELLDIPRLGCINIHASLLPKLRGAAPIQWAVINGDPLSGVTLMQMDAGLDTGDILAQESVPIAGDETGESLYEKLAALGGSMIVRYLPEIEAGTLMPVPQQEELSSYAPMLRKEAGQIDWSVSAARIERRLRGMLPWPGAFTTLDGQTLKIWKAEIADPQSLPEGSADGRPAPGTVLRTDKRAVYVACGEGVLALLEVQAEGRKRMETGAFLRGNPVSAGTVLGV
ncbi:MAG: methionyl-tRNA formyltransferase [Eubacteriales bacterium]|nr:methionyl-tRNA formyltransferase [Eubacteriales bacterium]